MKATKGLWLHLGLLGVATTVAFATSSAKNEPAEGKRVEAELVPGPADAVRLVTFEVEDRKVRVVPAKDSVGRYAVVEVTKEPSKAGAVDAGANASKPAETRRFIAVDEAEKLLSALAPAKSYRNLGRIEPARLVDYGLDKPEAKLTVQVGDKVHGIEIGALTPGSGDYYVRNPEGGLVSTFSADVIGKLKFSESRLLEHDLHGFAVDDVRGVEIHANGKSRKAVRVEGKADTWADATTPTKADETIGNWLAKVQRLRPQNYVEKPANVPNGTTVRIDYFDKTGKAGYLELYRLPEAAKRYLARSERTRWYVEVAASAAEPIETDIATIVK